MNAFEFVKKYGVYSFIVAKNLRAFDRYKYTIIYQDEIDFSNELIEKHKGYMFESQHIKRIVESHDLVKKFGGLDGARRNEESISFGVATKTWCGQGLSNHNLYLLRLRKAISDVEACQ